MTEHTHSHGHHAHSVSDNLKVAFFLNLAFTILEFFGGLFTNSVAILSDAVHDLGDTVAIGSALFLEKRSDKRPDGKFSYGYKRYSILSAAITSVVLIIGSVVIISQTIPRFIHPEEVNENGMMILAVLGIIFNGLAVLRLRKGSDDSLNQRAVMLHLFEDVLGWIAVLIGALAIKYLGWLIIDPILSMLIAIYILWNAVKNIRQALDILLQAKPQNIDMEKVSEQLRSHEDILDVHDMHIWTLDGEFNILTVHLVVDRSMKMEEIQPIKAELRRRLSEHNIPHATLEFEYEGDECTHASDI